MKITHHNPTAPSFPSDREETLVEVFSQEGDPAFVCGLCGRPNGDMIKQIEKDLNANRSFMDKGDGRYLYRVTYEEAQVGNEGRIELPAYWGLSLVAFSPNVRHDEAKITEAERRAEEWHAEHHLSDGNFFAG